MRILFITTYYPPDTTIAAVRPYGLAKYLGEMGHDVTVLRLGRCLEKPDFEKYGMTTNVKVVSCIEPQLKEPSVEDGIYGYGNLKSIKKHFVEFYRMVNYEWGGDLIFLPKYWILTWRKYHLEKKKLDELKRKGITFDIVISTFGDAENIFSGRYASKLWKCKWILDYRDNFPRGKRFSLLANLVFSKVELWSLKQPDVITAVSKGLIKNFGVNLKVPYYVIYNGYVKPSERQNFMIIDQRKFVFCYTGTIYSDLQDFTPLFRLMKSLADLCKIDLNNVELHYAGKFGSVLERQAERFCISNMIVDHGYVTASEAEAIQRMSDIYLVASWNYKGEEGMLSGKFYEGIRAKKPILALVAGNLSNSELYEIDQDYHYGFCYEEAEREVNLKRLEEYVLMQYERKMKGQELLYEPRPELFTNFRYDHLAKQMEKVCQEILN